MKIIMTFLLLNSIAFAADVTPESKFLVKAVSPETDASKLAGPQVKVLPPHRKIAYASQLPSPGHRDELFKKSGLSSSIESWDDFEKDSLYLRLTKSGSRPIDRILLKYPDLKREALEKAQELIQAEAR